MSTFREAVTPDTTQEIAPSPEVVRGGDSVTHIDTLLATYQEDQGNPYVAQYLDVKDVWDKSENLKNEVNTIEDYLRHQVKEGNLDNTTKAADKYLKELEKKAGANPYETITKRITKILAYIEFQRIING